MEISETVSLKTEKTSTSAQTVRKGSGFTFNPRTIFFTKIIVAVIALLWLFKSIRFEALLSSLTQADAIMVMLAFVLVAPNLLIQAIKWRWILNLSETKVSFPQAYKSLIAGMPLGFITPGRLGEFGRALFIRDLSKAQVLKFVALDKLSNMGIVIFFGLVGLATFQQLGFNKTLLLGTWFAVITVFTLFMVSFLNFSTMQLRKRLGVPRFSKREVLKLHVYSFLFFCVFTAQFCILVQAFSQVEIVHLLQAASAVFITKTALPIAIGDLGVREGAAVFFLGKITVAKAAAFNASILLFVFNVGVPAIIGLFELLKIEGIRNSAKDNKKTSGRWRLPDV